MKILCLQCASILNDGVTACPNCGEEIDRKAYNRVLSKLNQYILFGYQYREKYENQLKTEGEIKTKYQLLPLSDIFAWVGLAVLGGVIGGASWDFVKYVSKKIASQTDDDSLKEIVYDDNNLKIFANYLLDYHRSFKNIDDKVQDAIFEEMRAHQAEDDPPINFSFENKKLLLKYMKANAKKASEKHRKSKISSGTLNVVWKNVVVEDDNDN